MGRGAGQTQQGNINITKKMLKCSPFSRALVLRLNLVFFSCFLMVYSALILRRSSPAAYHENGRRPHLPLPLRVPSQLKMDGVEMKALLEDSRADHLPRPQRNVTKIEVPMFLKKMLEGKKRIGMINMDEDDVSEWSLSWDTVPVRFGGVSDLIEWKHLFPEWIDEEEESDVPQCPEIPMPALTDYDGSEFDLVVVKVPCKYPDDGWNRDVVRLQMHLVAANVAARKGRRRRQPRVAILSRCQPMIEIFRCDDLVTREGDWWVYEPEMEHLRQKVFLPVGSCRLALPLWGQGNNEVYDLSEIQRSTKTVKKEAYATVLHSSEAYVCGAIALAQSLIETGTKRDLVLLVDKSISKPKQDALAIAGWRIRPIERIRNPKAKKGRYNEYNYSKLRLWQLTDYNKIIFIDADIIVLRNLDLLFYFPQMSATGNDNWVFNSGIMVIEPSNCTFRTLMDHRDDIVSYNGGDQGFLNEIFVWWHRLPRRVNFLKNFWSNTTAEVTVKNRLFGADPPELYAIHYLGWKPWLCYRDYDCNWDTGAQRIYASDVAHRRWWKFHDRMDQRLHKFCALTRRRTTQLNWARRKSRLMKSTDQHWKIKIKDPRRLSSNVM